MNIQTPTSVSWTEYFTIFNATHKQQVNEHSKSCWYVAPDLHSQQIRHLPFILLLLFLWKTAASLCELKDRSPGSVFIAFSKCIDEFIEANEDDETLIKRLFSLSIFWLSLILTKSRN